MEMNTDLQKSPPSDEPTIIINDDYLPAEEEADRPRGVAYQAYWEMITCLQKLIDKDTRKKLKRTLEADRQRRGAYWKMTTCLQKLIDKEKRKKLKRTLSGEPTITINDDYVPAEDGEADRQRRSSGKSYPGAKRQKLDDEGELSIIFNPDF